MARPQTDLKVLEARGSIRKNPQRFRERMARAANAPTPVALGLPPERWNVPPEAMGAIKFARWKAIWNEFAVQIPDSTPMKRALLEMFCETMDRFRTNASVMKTSEKNYLLQLTCKLGISQGGHGSSQKSEGAGGVWEAFG
jgi:hypothetical protein